MEQDNFNKNIQEKFNFRTIEPSETAWNKLDAMLTLAEEKKQPKKQINSSTTYNLIVEKWNNQLYKPNVVLNRISSAKNALVELNNFKIN